MYSGAYVGLQVSRSYSKYELVTCPYHDDAHASGLFWKESGDFYCPSCKTSKKIRQLLVDMGKEDEYKGYMSELGAQFDLMPPSLDVMVDDGFVDFMDDPMAFAYLEGRGVDLDVAHRFGVMYSPSHEEIVFKTGVSGGWVGRCIARGDGPRYRIHGEKGAVWPHTAQLHEASHIILSEGPFKAMALATVVEEGALSVASMGSNPPLVFWQTMAQHAGNLTLIADDDEPGRKFAKECKRRLAGVRIFAPSTPFDEMDRTAAKRAYDKIFSRRQTMGGF
ncbi:MAG: toprim domain-containing protein [Microbacteriaceae bacterium]|nr:toprim domain-containing protein [Microbacteriaceae bacterium]